MPDDVDTDPVGSGPATFAVLLRAFRERGLLTQEELAERAGLSVRTIGGLEAGRVLRPRSGSTRLLADALGLQDAEREALFAASRRKPAVPEQDAQPGGATRAGGSPAGEPPGEGSLGEGPLGGLPPVPAQLPADAADFVGRGGALRQLDGLLRSGARSREAVAILTISGTAGIGKTALAIHWAHRVAGRFPDGQLYVNLRGYAAGLPLTPIQALSQLLRTLGVAATQVPVDEEEAAALYRSLLAGKRMLVLLDNARSAEQVRPLIPGSGGCVVLITSRDGLTGLFASHGSQRLALDALTDGEAVKLLGRLVGEARVAAEPAAVAELAQVCGGLPLAVRIAGANLGGLQDVSIATYVGGLRGEARLAGLTVPDDPRIAVAAAFDSSYAILPADGQRLMRLLGLVPGPEFTVPAAAALTGGSVEQVELLLARLASAHLVERRGPGRFAFHDLLRLYAHERATREDSEPERSEAVERLSAWYAAHADAAARLLYPDMLRLPSEPPGDAPAGKAPATDAPAGEATASPIGFSEPTGALAWLDVERANLVAAAQHAAKHGPLPIAWLLADALRGYFRFRRYTIDWLAVAEAGLAAAMRHGDLRAQAVNLLALGDASQTIGRYQQAIGHYSVARDVARRAGWTDGQAAALGNLGNVLWETGDLRQAAEKQAETLALYRQSGRRAGEATTLLNLGVVERTLGWLERAASHVGQALALYREVDSRNGEAMALMNLGSISHELGRLDEALDQLTEALALGRQVGHRYAEASVLCDLALAHRDAGRLERALELAEDALELASEIGDQLTEGESLNALGTIDLAFGRPRQAVDRHQQALDLARRTDLHGPEANALLGLAGATLRLGQHDQAADHARAALLLARQTGFRGIEGRALTALVGIVLARAEPDPTNPDPTNPDPTNPDATNPDATNPDPARGGPSGLDHASGLDQAAEQARQALTVHRETGYRIGQARTLAMLGDIVRRTGSPEAAVPYWNEAIDLFTEIGSPEAGEVRARLEAGDQGAGDQGAGDLGAARTPRPR